MQFLNFSGKTNVGGGTQKSSNIAMGGDLLDLALAQGIPITDTPHWIAFKVATTRWPFAFVILTLEKNICRYHQVRERLLQVKKLSWSDIRFTEP